MLYHNYLYGLPAYFTDEECDTLIDIANQTGNTVTGYKPVGENQNIKYDTTKAIFSKVSPKKA